MQEIVIITRRFNEHNYGVGVVENDNKYYRYNSHPINENFLKFWAKMFVKNSLIKDHLSTKVYLRLYESLKQNAGRDSLKKIFDTLDEQVRESTRLKETTKYLTMIQEFLVYDKSVHIFIYHHWLDKQGFENSEENKTGFLEALRQNVAEITGGDIHVNWLIHDTDILSSSYNDILYMDGKSYHPNITSETMNKLVPDTLKGDNIWCFIHEANRTGLYKNIILDFHKKIWTADSLYAELKFDKNGCIRRLQMLDLTNNNVESLKKEMLVYILQKDPDTLGIREGISVCDLKKMIEK